MTGFQSTPSARRATGCCGELSVDVNISIHALREEGDGGQHQGKRRVPISIHALREESDMPQPTSTPTTCDFNPRPPRGERPRYSWSLRQRSRNFNPRPPRGERLHCLLFQYSHLDISIHALREESDPCLWSPAPWQADFNPRPPRGERLIPRYEICAALGFQSTPSARRATPWRKSNRTRFRISIHALREESDLRGFLAGRWLFDFNPRPPRGERLAASCKTSEFL